MRRFEAGHGIVLLVMLVCTIRRNMDSERLALKHEGRRGKTPGLVLWPCWLNLRLDLSVVSQRVVLGLLLLPGGGWMGPLLIVHDQRVEFVQIPCVCHRVHPALY